MIIIKQKDLVEAYEPVQRLAKQPIPKQNAFELYELKLMLQKHRDFQAEQEMNKINELGAYVGPDGNINFKSKEDGEEFIKMRKELEEVEIKLNMEIIDLTDVDLMVSADDAAAVRPLIRLM